MTMLEIFNRDEARPLIAQINVLYRTTATNTMFFMATKGIFLNILSIFALFFVVLAGWEVVDGNKVRRKKKIESWVLVTLVWIHTKRDYFVIIDKFVHECVVDSV